VVAINAHEAERFLNGISQDKIIVIHRRRDIPGVKYFPHPASYLTGIFFL
jgi:hypothetical protein